MNIYLYIFCEKEHVTHLLQKYAINNTSKYEYTIKYSIKTPIILLEYTILLYVQHNTAVHPVK